MPRRAAKEVGVGESVEADGVFQGGDDGFLADDIAAKVWGGICARSPGIFLTWIGYITEYEEKNRRGWLGFQPSRLAFARGLICVFCLALFLHFREVRLEVLELNTTAGRYIVAQIDFEFPDYETTIVLKQQAMQDVGEIYQIDDKQIRDARYLLEEDLIHNKDWRTAAPSSTFEEMYKAADELETLLLEARFTDPRTIQKIKELHLPDASYFEYHPGRGQRSSRFACGILESD